MKRRISETNILTVKLQLGSHLFVCTATSRLIKLPKTPPAGSRSSSMIGPRGCIILYNSIIALFWTTKIQRICPGQRRIRDSGEGFGVRNIRIGDLRTRQRGFRDSASRDSGGGCMPHNYSFLKRHLMCVLLTPPDAIAGGG